MVSKFCFEPLSRMYVGNFLAVAEGNDADVNDHRSPHVFDT